MVIDDVRALPTAPIIVAEGSTVPASIVGDGIADRTRAVWLLPTEGFQQAQLAGHVAGARRLYSLLRNVIEQEARAYGAPVLSVDGTRGVDEITRAVEGTFCGRHRRRAACRHPGGSARLAPRGERGRGRAGPGVLRPALGPGRPRAGRALVSLRVRADGVQRERRGDRRACCAARLLSRPWLARPPSSETWLRASGSGASNTPRGKRVSIGSRW